MSGPAIAERDGQAGGGRRRTPGDQVVFQQIYDAIVDHRLSPGTRLAEDTLGEIFGVSRTVVRKALFRLAHENIVEMRPNRGAIVARPTVAEARDVFEARQVVERAIVARAIEVAGADDIERLRGRVRDERAAHAAGDRESWIRLSGGFHLHLAALAGNGVLARFLKELVSRSSLIIALYESPSGAVCSFDDHKALIDALAAGDRARAEALMDAHLAACADGLSLQREDKQAPLTEVFAGIARARK